MARVMSDCRRTPSETHCTLVIIGEEEEVLRAAAEHAESVHGHPNTKELRERIRVRLEPAEDYEPQREPQSPL